MEPQSPIEVFLTTVHCKRHHVLSADCECGMHQWHPVFQRGEPAVLAMRAATGCSAADAWAHWADDTGSQASTSASTIAYGYEDVADTEDEPDEIDIETESDETHEPDTA